MPPFNLDVRATDLSEGPVLFAVAGSEDQGLSSEPHRHARGQLFGSLRGLLTICLEDGVWIVPPSQAVWLPPHCLHSGKTHGPFNGWSAYVSEHACQDLPSNACTLRTSGLLREAVLRASTWSAGPLDPSQARVAGVILDEVRSLPVEPLGLMLPRDPRLLKIAKALIANPADDRDLESWSRWVCASSRTLSRRFVAETGFNFTTWRQRARLMRALEMLAEGRPITAIALDLGYSTASAFIELFRRTFGETPAVYRSRL
ncbi:AraC-like DNA-binding protein [Pseudomonas sp. TE3786]